MLTSLEPGLILWAQIFFGHPMGVDFRLICTLSIIDLITPIREIIPVNIPLLYVDQVYSEGSSKGEDTEFTPKILLHSLYFC